jgi:acyl transferase domain-containing protein
MANISADSIQYIETHGTGTRLGDPIEIAGLTQAFRQTTQSNAFCAIGSVKPNIGHLDAAAGIAGFIKVVLMLKNRILPASLHFKTPNPNINFAESPFFVNTTTKSWDSKEQIRRAGISAFGIGGTNAHLILEEAPKSSSVPIDNQHYLMCLSAKSSQALENKVLDLRNFLQQHPNISPKDIAYSLLVGRESFPYRKAFIFPPLQNKDTVFSSLTNKASRIAFLFPGQGTQQINMGQTLYFENPIFRYWLDLGANIAARYLHLNLLTLLYPETTIEHHNYSINDTLFAQPILFITEYALAQCWLSLNLKPQVMVGHSPGRVRCCLPCRCFFFRRCYIYRL